MCGVAGVIGRESNSQILSATVRMTRKLAHRGPDGQGFWWWTRDGSGVFTGEENMPAAAQLAIGNRRLSIVDVAGGAQPMANEDETIWVSFNGEIYNQLELRRELERAGHGFATNADTEVLVHGWEEWGERLFGKLNGIFAFAIADADSGDVVLVRDPVGVKPLFVGLSGSATWWSSEVGAARAVGLIEHRVATEAVKLFLTFRFVPSPYSIYENVWKVPPGHFVRLRRGNAGRAPTFTSYRCEITSPSAPTTTRAWREALGAELEAAVERQLMGDVPIASLLSGGVDSSLVTLFISRHLPYKPMAFGIGFASDGDRSEVRAGSLAARDLDVTFDGEVVQDDAYVEALPRALVRLGDPLANTGGFLVQMLCAKVRARHKVVLTGQGADEPLGGYPRHAAERLHSVARLVPGPSAAVARLLIGSDSGERLRRIAAARDRVDRYVEILSVVTREQVDLLVPDRHVSCDELARKAVRQWVSPDEPTDPLNELLRVDARMSLADDLLLVADHFSMSESVELRVPFLDLRFLELVERMPSRYKLSPVGSRKWLYREMAARKLPPPLSRRVCGISARLGRKQGFTTPHGAWFGARESPLGTSEAWVQALERIPAISQTAVTDLLERRTNGGGIRQRAALYALATWAELTL